MRKKYLSIAAVFILSTLFSCIPAEAQEHRIEKKEMTIYIGAMENYDELNVYFMDGVTDLPWVELKEWSDFMNSLFQSFYMDQNYQLDYSLEGEEAVLKRENGYSMLVDFSENNIFFDDYNAFIHHSRESSLQDVLPSDGFNDEGEPELFMRSTDASFDRAGDSVLLDLNEYEIELVFQDGRGYIPFQTMGDFLISPSTLMNTFFNENALFLASYEEFGCVQESLTPLGEYYYSAEPHERSEALASFGYHELCMAMDHLYGLKEKHDIDSFDQIFWQIAYDEMLQSTDPEEADIALYSFIDYYLDDLHSGFFGYSWMTGNMELDAAEGISQTWYDKNDDIYRTRRAAALGDDFPKYQEVGNTAYITFDTFDSNSWNVYYDAVDGGELPDDTIGLVIYAHTQIYREDSPIENVVIDLSCNSGGSVDAGLFLLGWVLGDTPYCVKDTFTGALSTVIYRSDTNLDREFDSRDEVDDKNIYCLISPLSFSCGNLVPAVFKDSQRVTLLGRTSGGGSCTVQPMSTAWGSIFQISGPTRMSFLKNGSFYDIDAGVEPDIYLSHIENYYDREALTDYINGLF